MTYLFLTLGEFSKFPSAKRATGIGEALALRGHKVFISSMDCPENRKRLLIEAPHCEPCYFKRGNAFLEAFAKLRLVWKLRPRYVYSLSYSLRNLAFLRLFIPRGCQTIIEFNELYSCFSEHHLSWLIREFWALVENRYVLCASSYLVRFFKAKAAKWKLDCQFLYLPFAYPEYLTSPVGCDDALKHLVFMAHMSRGYGVFEVLEAFSHVVSRRPEAYLDLIGGGPDLRDVENWVEVHGVKDKVAIHGYVAEDKLNALFSKAAMFVAPLHDIPQDWARCPSKVFYYIPYNKPIVTCRIGDPYENLGEYAIYYKPDDVEDMERAMLSALQLASSFSYPPGFIARHSWGARAESFERWTSKND